MKSYSGPPATLGSTATAGARIVVWCRACRHQVEPDPAAMAERYGADPAVRDWHKRLVCSQCGSPGDQLRADGARRGDPYLAHCPPSASSPSCRENDAYGAHAGTDGLLSASGRTCITTIDASIVWGLNGVGSSAGTASPYSDAAQALQFTRAETRTVMTAG